MGRMSDARKRARPGVADGGKTRGHGATDEPGVAETAPPARPPAADVPSSEREAALSEPPPKVEASWVTREESFVFPAESKGPVSTRIALPSSGLAEDILALAEVAAVPAGSMQETMQLSAPGETGVDAGARSHNISFFASPDREEKRAVEATEHLATFFLGREEYGIDVRLVQEIIRVSEITQVPRAPEFI